jgi:hypothetical protein
MPKTTRPELLYHFTCRPWWHFIRQDGINRGDTPTSMTEGKNLPNLTSNPDPLAQAWSGPGEGFLNKTAVRIAVRVPLGDDLLIPYREFADLHGMDRRTYRLLDEAGGWEAKNWWVYRGVVPPEWFVDVEFLDGDRIGDLERRALQVVEMSSTFEEAVRRMHGRHDRGAMYFASPEMWDLEPASGVIAKR